jgi:hypothetical protein
VIALIGNRPTIQVGSYQIHDYDTRWIGDALRRAARAADSEQFPFLDEIRRGIEEYLESRCSLRMIPLSRLYDRMRRMLREIGCGLIADKLETLAPPVPLPLDEIARAAGDGFELAFFERLRAEIEGLRHEGVEELHFTGLRDAVRILCRRSGWDAECRCLDEEIRAFLMRQHHEFRFGATGIDAPLLD